MEYKARIADGLLAEVITKKMIILCFVIKMAFIWCRKCAVI